MTEPFIGIDFGTSRCSVAWFNPQAGRAEVLRNAEGEEKTPSVVYYGATETLVGTHAEQQLEDEVERQRVVFSIKRELVNVPSIALPGRRVKPVEVATAILAKLRQDADEYHFHQPITRTVITCPAAFDILQREKIREAATLAGFTDIALIEEPVAAALAYANQGLRVGERVLVYDLGAGTFDLALLTRANGSFRLALEPRGLARCGGDDFDRALYDHCERLTQQTLGRPIDPQGKTDLLFLRQCRQKKEALSAHERVNWFTYLAADAGVVPFKTNLERTVFEKMISERVEQTVRLTQGLMADSNSDGKAADTLVLIGGSSRVPMVTQRLRDALTLDPLRWERQDVAVALGAAYHAHYLWGSTASHPQRVTPIDETIPTQNGGQEEQRVEPTHPVAGPEVEAEYRRLVEQVAIATGGQLSAAALEQLQTMVVQFQLTKEQAARVEEQVLGQTKAETMRLTARQTYLQAVQTLWIGRQVTTAHVEKLAALAATLGLGAGEANQIEQQIWGRNGAALAAAQADYGQQVSRIQERLTLSQADIEALAQHAQQLGLDGEQAASVERMVLGGAGTTLRQMHSQARNHRNRLNQYQNAASELGLMQGGYFTNDDLEGLTALANSLELSKEECADLERQLFRQTKEEMSKATKAEQYRHSLQVVQRWPQGQRTKEHFIALTERVEALALEANEATAIEREILGSTREQAHDDLVRPEFPDLHRDWNWSTPDKRWVAGVAWHPDGRLLAVGSHDSYLRYLNDSSRNATVLGQFAASDEVNAIAYSPDGQQVAAGSKNSTLRIFNMGPGNRTLSGHSKAILALAFSQKGYLLASGSEDEKILLWDSKSDKPAQTLRGHSGAIQALAFHGQTLASGSADKTIRLWHSETGKVIRTIEVPSSVLSLVFHPQGHLLVSGHADNHIRLWHSETGKAYRSLTGHTGGGVQALAFHPLGNILASGGADLTIRLWNFMTGQPLARISNVHNGGFTKNGCLSLAFNPVQQVLASGGCDGRVLFLVPKSA